MSGHSGNSGTLFVRIFLLLLGAILILPALNKLHTYIDFRLFGTTVIGHIDHPAAARDIGGKPLIQYRDPAGNLHEFKSAAKTHWLLTPKKGEPITVFIHRHDPERAIADSLFHYAILPLIFFSAGCYCCFHGIRPQTKEIQAT